MDQVELVIIVVMLLLVDLYHKIPATLTIIIGGQDFMLKGEVDRILRPATLPPITQVTVVDF